MYIRKASLKNVRSISEMDWAVQAGKEAGWHVILGDNGSGKSSFLRALALVLVGPRNAEALRLDWNQWITRGTKGWLGNNMINQHGERGQRGADVIP